MATPKNTNGTKSPKQEQQVSNLFKSAVVSYNSINPQNNQQINLDLDPITFLPTKKVKITSLIIVKKLDDVSNPYFVPNAKFQIILVNNGKENVIDIKEENIKNTNSPSGIYVQQELDVYENGVYNFQIITSINGEKFSSKTTQFIINSSVQSTGNILATTLNEAAGFNFQAPFLESFLYKGSKNKVLFRINKFFPVPTSFSKSPSKSQEDTDNFYKSLFLGLKATIYRTTTQPININEIINENNVYKILISEEDEFSYNDFLDTDVDYYYAVRVEHKTIKGTPQSISEIQKIRLVKDSEFYYLSKSIFKFSDIIDEKYETTFMNKFFIDSGFGVDSINQVFKKDKKYSSFEKFLFSGQSTNSFNSANNFPYIKIRLTSKKTNRKIDLNLNYIFQLKNLDISEKNYLKGKINENIELVYILTLEKKKILANILKADFLYQLKNLLDIINEYNKKQNKNVKYSVEGDSTITNLNSKDFENIKDLVKSKNNQNLSSILSNFERQFIS